MHARGRAQLAPTTGCAAAIVVAVTTVANGAAAATTAATLAAGAFIGSSVGLAVAAVDAMCDSNSLSDFERHGEAALFSTTVGALTGLEYGRELNKAQCQCFIAGTLVRTKAGPVPIEEIAPGDLVWAADPDTGEAALKRVVRTFVSETEELIHVTVQGEEIICTPGHPFYSPVQGWTEACRLSAGDILVLVNGEFVVVEQVQQELLETPVLVFNLEVEDFHTYFVSASGVLVHNKCSDVPTSPKQVKESELTEFDVHQFKEDFVGKANISKFNIYKDTANQGVLWLGNKKTWVETGYYFTDLKIMYTK